MITLTHPSKASLTLFNNLSSTLPEEAQAVLHITERDGLSDKEQINFLQFCLNRKSEWYIHWGPDALIWTYKAEAYILSQFPDIMPDEYCFQSLSYDEDSRLEEILHKFTSLSSPSHDNQAYQDLYIISDHDGTLKSLTNLGYQA